MYSQNVKNLNGADVNEAACWSFLHFRDSVKIYYALPSQKLWRESESCAWIFTMISLHYLQNARITIQAIITGNG